MVVKLQDVLGLPCLNKLKLVGGASGLDRVLHWAHVVDLPDVVEWVQGGELLFTTGIGIRGNLDQLPQVIRECYAKDVAGLIINVGPHIQVAPPEVISLADELGFPVFELPWEVQLVEATRGIYNFIAVKHIEEKSVRDILENILYGSADTYDNLAVRAASCGYDLAAPHQIMMIKFEQLSAYLREVQAFTEHQILVVKLQIQDIIQEVFERWRKKILTLVWLDTAIIMMPTFRTYEAQQVTREIADALACELQERFAGLHLHIGWGNPYSDISEAKKSLSQAEQAMKVAQSLTDSLYMGFDELGFYKVLFNVKDRSELESFRSEVLETLLDYDQKHSAEMVNTLSVFLEENENFSRVSERLFIHRNTLKYRLQKIVEISGRNLAEPKDRMLLYFATIVHKFLDL
ncbi:MAG TPA: PucR family transcriptional regulator ligand-binding domain-containing protein [Patescibacteria group bacterium]|nr:PucR family transcriptional regulator ligand-binding domain-containing protein [Patescibacteria group bacterium]